MLRHWSQFVPNMSTDIRGHEAPHHHHDHQNDLCIKAGSDESELNVSVIVRDHKVDVHKYAVLFCHLKKRQPRKCACFMVS